MPGGLLSAAFAPQGFTGQSKGPISWKILGPGITVGPRSQVISPSIIPEERNVLNWSSMFRVLNSSSNSN
ncbi:hypothetical protein RRG08_027734 [Elysia crispata]|uniref:Uncharacterized protein n=1 Tax=Elysia crispata TaxID=231223 RepID=A0AAE1CV30_9GAST|nr:hypothetical protein RRG08_027734 [Elysia crispata]